MSTDWRPVNRHSPRAKKHKGPRERSAKAEKGDKELERSVEEILETYRKQLRTQQ